MSRLSDSDEVLHDPDGNHLTEPPAGTRDQAAWREQLRRHLAQHRRKGQDARTPWDAGRHIPGRLRTDRAEPGS